MNNFYTYTCKNGFKCYLIKKPGFVKKYCAIGVSYGGANLEFKYKNKIYKSPDGIAHFIEHKLFQMPDGSDALELFSNQNAMANAYTSYDKTMYLFEKNDDVYPSLKLLIDMFFTPVFNPIDVEREKDIIVSELKMNLDKPQYNFYQKSLETLYPNDSFSKEILGSEESIRNITDKDLALAYEAFYTPENSKMICVGDFDENELFKFVESSISLYKARKTALKIKTVKSIKPAEPLTYYDKISQDEISVMLRLDYLTNKDPFACEMLIGILDNFLSLSASFYKELDEKKLFDGDIEYEVISSFDSTYINIFAPSKKPLKFAKEIINKINNLTYDLNDDLIDIYLKHIKARCITNSDGFEALGDNVLSLALEEIDYFESIEKLLSLKKEDFYKYIDYLKKSLKTYVICKKNA